MSNQVRCDNCDQVRPLSTTAAYHKWISFRRMERPRVDADLDFCSWACLALWAGNHGKSSVRDPA